MKKIVSILLAIVCLAFATLSFASCKKEVDLTDYSEVYIYTITGDTVKFLTEKPSEKCDHGIFVITKLVINDGKAISLSYDYYVWSPERADGYGSPSHIYDIKCTNVTSYLLVR